MSFEVYFKEMKEVSSCLEMFDQSQGDGCEERNRKTDRLKERQTDRQIQRQIFQVIGQGVAPKLMC